MNSHLHFRTFTSKREGEYQYTYLLNILICIHRGSFELYEMNEGYVMDIFSDKSKWFIPFIRTLLSFSSFSSAYSAFLVCDV